MIQYLRRLCNWLEEGWFVWLGLVLVLIAFVGHPNELRIRIMGLALQVLGITAVALGIHKTRVLFGRPALIFAVPKWLSRFPKYRPRGVTGQINITGRSPIVSFTAYQWINPVDASLDARITALEENLKGVNEQVYRIKDLLCQEVRNREDALKLESQTREKENQEFNQKFEMSETGGLEISAMALVWLAFGLIMSTLSNEIGCFFSK